MWDTPVDQAQCICGCSNRWILWWMLLICDACGEAYEMKNDELIHSGYFNTIREERRQKGE